MSGSGGGGGGGVVITDSVPVTCDMLVINTQLSSPKLAVLNGLQAGEDLLVAMQGQIVVVLRNGQIAGGLAAPDLKRLRECILAGTNYVATVTSASLGQFKVKVTAVGA